MLDIDLEHLNSDRLGRALDAAFPCLESIRGSVSLAAIQAFGIEAAVFPWDFTTLSFSGAYPEADKDPDGPKIARGPSKDGRGQDKQVQVGFGRVAHGATPLHHRVIGGNAAEVRQVVTALEALKKVAQRACLLLVGDTKLDFTNNLLAACRAKARFAAPMPASEVLWREFPAIPREQFAALDFESDREQCVPEDERSTYQGSNQPWDIKDKKTGEVFALRRSRARQLEKAELNLQKLQRKAGTHHYPAVKKVREKALAILRQRRVSPFYRFDAQEHEGKVTVEWTHRSEALAEAVALDGYYGLVTNPPD